MTYPSNTLYPSETLYPGEQPNGSSQEFTPVPFGHAVRAEVKWQFLLANTADMSPICDLQATGKKLNPVLNRGGTFSGTCHTRSDTGMNIRRGKTCVLAIRNGIQKWSGPVWTMNPDFEAQTISFGCVGWYEFLIHRLLRQNQLTGLPLVNYRIDDIAYWLLARANEQGFSIIGAPSSTFIVQGASVVSDPDLIPVIPNMTWNAWANIGQEIQTLSDMENGFDMEVDPVTRAFNIYHPRIGTDKPDLHYGFQCGPNNLQNVTITEDQSRYCNRMNALGTTNWRLQDDLEQQAEYGLFEEQVALSDIDNPDVLQAYASEEVIIRSNPVQFTLKTLPATEDNWFPRPYDDLSLGDNFRFSAQEGQFVFDHQVARNFGMSIDITDEGDEILTDITTILSGA